MSDPAPSPPAALPAWRRHLPLAVAVVTAAVLLVSCVHRAGPSERTDLPVYLAAAHAVGAGEDPLGVTSRRGWPYVYPPTLAVGLLPLTPLPQRAAAAVWFLISLAAFVAGALATRRALGRQGPFAWRQDGVPLLLVFFPTASALLRGQVGPLLLGLAGAAALCLVRRRDLTAGLLLALAAAIKLTPAWVLIGLRAAPRCRAGAVSGPGAAGRGGGVAGGALGLVVFLVLVPLPFLGPSGTAQALEHFSRRMVLRPLLHPGDPDVTAKGVHVGNNQSLTSQVIRRLPTGHSGRAALLALIAAGGLASLVVCARAGPPAGAGVTAVGLLLAAPLLVAPVAWHHHHVLLLPALWALLLARDRADPALARAITATLALFAALSVLHFALKPARDWGLLGLATLVVYAVAAARVLEEREEQSLSR